MFCFVPVSNVASFKLPDPAGRAGGALSSCLLNVTYADHHDTAKDLSWKDVLGEVRGQLKTKGYKQIPQLSSSRPTDLDEIFTLAPKDFSGTKRAVMIGINYIGDDPGELSGCHNDVLNVSHFFELCFLMNALTTYVREVILTSFFRSSSIVSF